MCIRDSDNKYRIFIPYKIRYQLVAYCHKDAMHPGMNKTVDVIHRFFDWPGCCEDVEEYVHICEICNQNKRRLYVPQGDMHNVVAFSKGELLAIDNFGPLPPGRGGVEKLLVVLDVFTKYVRLYPCKKATAESSIQAMEKYISDYGLPRTILSDNGTNFTSREWRRHWHEREVNLRYTSVYHPAANPAERVM